MSSSSVAANSGPLLKLMLVGPRHVGKTCLLYRETEYHFRSCCTTTIGIDFKSHQIELEDGQTIRLQIWDIAYESRFRTAGQIARTYRGVQGIMFVYDITQYKTLDEIESWIEQVKQYNVPETCVRILIGTKLDLEDKREIEYEQAKALADKYDMRFFETSSLAPTNVEAAFLTFATDIKNAIDTQQQLTGGNINLTNPNTAPLEGGCCF